MLSVAKLVIFIGRDLAKIRRIILPDRVFGNCGAHCNKSGVAIGPIWVRVHCRNSVASESSAVAPATKVT